MAKSLDNLVWIDLETTGLDPESRVILEIACLVTDKDLNELGDGVDLVVHQEGHAIGQLDPWCVKQHAASGLLDASRASTTSLTEAETLTLAYVRRYCLSGKAPLSGNSVCFDRGVLIRDMPKLEAYFHYRNVDVSSIKELARRWRPTVVEKQTKASRHRALDDLRESIAELRLYRKAFFKEPE
ncbi:MAG: oligoribonuclease [Candidatus Bipolaricaulota bacterium]|nr:oligoribonuclease [Candidatus Bipolaricaulota bacterium]